MQANALKLPSFAKINWTLQVFGRRADGYHELLTVLQTISLHDELIFEQSEAQQFFLSCSSPTIPADETNLVWQAATALREQTGTRLGATVHLNKQIPSKAGLGGGSSNAAVALIGLNELWQCGLSLEELAAIGAGLGADVPFFFTGGTARCEGTGTTLVALTDAPTMRLIVLSPSVSISTKDAYIALNRPTLTTSGSTSILARSFAGPNLADCDKWQLNNDFEDVIFEIEPEIRRAKQALLDSGARGALLAGSGSSVFGIFADEEARQCGLESLILETGWRVFSCNTISRADYFTAFNLPFLRSSQTKNSDTGA